MLKDEVFVCIDCETTGLNAKDDRIIEVAVACFTFDTVLDQFESLIDPGCDIPESSSAIHHITNDMVKGKPRIEEVLPSILKMINRHVIIGHGVGFDIEIIAQSAERAGIACLIRNNRSIDTLRLARHYGESPVNSLEYLRKHFNIEEEGAHRAMNDVIVNMEVFKFLTLKYKTLQQVFDLLSKPALLKIMPLGKHKGRPMKEVPIEYLRWAAHKDFDEDLLFSIRTELKRRKSGNLFSQAGNPFSSL